MKPRKLLVSLSLAAASVAAYAAPYAPQDFDFSEIDSLSLMSAGTVERVQEVPLPSRLQPLADFFEHSVRPQTADQLLIRLDDGRAITLEQDGTQRFEAGQRVRVFAYMNGAHVERE